MEKEHLQQRKDEESNEAVDSSSNRTELSGKSIIYSIKQGWSWFFFYRAVSNKSHTPSSSSAPEAMEPPPADNIHTSTNETTPLLPKGASQYVTRILLLGCARDRMWSHDSKPAFFL